MFGGASRDRTDGLVIANDALSQLSYGPTIWRETTLKSLTAFALDTKSGSRRYNEGCD